MKMNLSPQMQKLTGATGLVYIGALVSGIYQGVYESKGIPVDPSTTALIRYGPLVVSGILGIKMSRIAKEDGSLDDVVEDAVKKTPFTNSMNNNEIEQAKSNLKGCAPVLYPMAAITVVAGFEFVGYIIGRNIGRI